MAIGPRLDLRLTQGLVMTPQLQQAIKLLQLNNMELNEFLKEELEKNPLLERDDNEPEERGEKETQYIESENQLDEIQALKQKKTDREEVRDAEPLDTDNTNIWSTEIQTGSGEGGSSNFDDSEFSYEKTLSKEKSLREHLTEQLYFEFGDEEEEYRTIGLALIDRLSAAGYLREPIDEVAFSLSIDLDKVVHVWEIVKEFDPTGIFAKDLSECLALQLKEKNRFDPAMEALVNNLDLLGAREHETLLKKCGVDLEDLKDMILEIRSLNPKPASLFDDIVVQTAIPDVIMTPQAREVGGGWMVELNPVTLPRVLVNKRYYTEISKMAHNKQEKEFVEEQFQNANWLIRAMDQRAQTILKVATEIIRQQDAFFAYGLEYLKPMVLKDIAEKIEMHESTVSRVTTGKYIGTPRGLFELKFFFSSGVGSTDGGMSHSSSSIKAKIGKLIEEEKPEKILSDEAIAKILKEEGVDIARRTVAKYREALGLPTSAQRKRDKRSIL